MARSPSSAPNRRRCGRPRSTTGRPTRPSSPDRTRRAAGAGSSIAPVPASWPLARGNVRFHASLTPFRHFGFFPDMAPQWDFMRERVGRRRCAQPVRLHRGRHAARCPTPARGWSMSTRRRNRSRAAAPTPCCRGWASGRSAGSSTTPPNSPRAKCAASAATTASCSTRPSSGAARPAKCGGSKTISRPCSPIAASCSTPTAASSC